MSSIIALIPARSGSKGVKNKNIKLLGGHSLLEWSIQACKHSHMINQILVSTDSLEYAKLAKIAGANVPFLRPKELSDDHSSDYEFIKHALDWLQKNDSEPDYIVHIRPTTPFRDSNLIDQAIKLFIDNPCATALRSVHLMSESAYKTFEIASTGQLKRLCCDNTDLDVANNARQIFPMTYIANGYVDVLSTTFIRRTSLIHGNHVIPFFSPFVTEIDTEDDFSVLEAELLKHPEFIQKVFK